VEADAPGKVMEDGAHRGGLTSTRWRMGGGTAAFRSGVGVPVAAVPPTSFCGRRERQRGELRAKTEGREKERAGAAVTGSRGGGATPELEAVLPKEEGDDDRVWRERERKERRARCQRLSTRDKGEGWGKGGPVRGGCKKGRGPDGVGTWRLVELRRRRGGGVRRSAPTQHRRR
jgi:hypothetical protein